MMLYPLSEINRAMLDRARELDCMTLVQGDFATSDVNTPRSEFSGIVIHSDCQLVDANDNMALPKLTDNSH